MSKYLKSSWPGARHRAQVENPFERVSRRVILCCAEPSEFTVDERGRIGVLEDFFLPLVDIDIEVFDELGFGFVEDEPAVKGCDGLWGETGR